MTTPNASEPSHPSDWAMKQADMAMRIAAASPVNLLLTQKCRLIAQRFDAARALGKSDRDVELSKMRECNCGAPVVEGQDVCGVCFGPLKEVSGG